MSGGGPGPDFVAIGAQKAGTTWLYDNLVVQQSVWMPPVKELHFFNRISPPEELLGVEERGYTLWQRYRPLLDRPTPATFRWLRRFHHEPLSTDWYYRLFPRHVVGERLAGDITPAYSTLDQRGVDFARRVLKPGCRVFLIVRNPIERVWSGVKMMYRWKGESVEATDVERLIEQFRIPTHRLRGDYPRMIGLWQAAFGDDFRIFRYDHLAADPAAFLESVCTFIGAGPALDRSRLGERSNQDPAQKQMPDRVHAHLREEFEEEILALDELVPGVAAGWLDGS